MHLSEYKNFVGNVAVVTTALQFLSGIPVCRNYVKNKSTGETSPLFFICGFISCIFWLHYGISIEDSKIIMINLFGVTLFFSYIVVFFTYTFKKLETLKQLTLAMFLFLMTYLVIVNAEGESRINLLGMIACCLSVLTIASPLGKLLYVIRVQSTEVLPFPMILMSFLLSTSWFLYGIINEDNFLIVPNFIGGLLSALQLVLFLIYPNTPPTPNRVKGSIADDEPHESQPLNAFDD